MVIFFLVMRDIQINSPISILIKSLLNADVIRWLELSSSTSGIKDANLLCHQIWPQHMTMEGSFTDKVGQLPIKHAKFTYYTEMVVNYLQNGIVLNCSDT